MKIVCSLLDLPAKGCDFQYLLYGRPTILSIGSAGPDLVSHIQSLNLRPSNRAWDLLSLATSIVAADESCSRADSPDGWTRVIELDVAVAEPDFWNTQIDLLNKLLAFLTGDIWTVTFSGGGFRPHKMPATQSQPYNVACLLSGGVDSLVGAIDLVSQGNLPIFVSQVAKGDKLTQSAFASFIEPKSKHLQLNHNIQHRHPSERSQRSRSFIFLSFGVIAATSLDRYHNNERVELHVPENGFISLNVPLTPLRVGSLSTRTTHPVVLSQFQKLLDNAGINVEIKNPFQFHTKGELLAACGNEKLLNQLVFGSTSCGRYSRYGFQHCGRCVPCLVRRAAFRKWGIKDSTTKGYKHDTLTAKSGDDVRAVSMAIEKVRQDGLDSWVSGSLNRAVLGDLNPYHKVLKSGLSELEKLLKSYGAL